MGEPLAAQVDHLVTKQRVADLLELFIRDLGGLQAADFGTHGGGQRAHLYVPVGAAWLSNFPVG